MIIRLTVLLTVMALIAYLFARHNSKPYSPTLTSERLEEDAAVF